MMKTWAICSDRRFRASRLAALILLSLLSAGPLRAAAPPPTPAPTPGIGAIEIKTKAKKLAVTQLSVQEQPAAALESISIANLNGRVSVTGWDENKIRIGVQKELTVPLGVEEAEAKNIFQQIAVDGRPKGKRLEIKVTHPKLASGMNAVVNIFIDVPRAMVVDAASRNGNVQVEKLQKAVTARSENGNIAAIALGGKLTARTNNGNIEAAVANGPMDAKSGNGNIKCHVFGDVKAETQSGNIEITLNGPTNVPGALVCATESIEASTKTGQVTVVLSGKDQGMMLDAQCGVGTIQSDYPIAIHKNGIGQNVKQVVGNGSPKIMLRANTGGIRILDRSKDAEKR